MATIEVLTKDGLLHLLMELNSDLDKFLTSEGLDSVLAKVAKTGSYTDLTDQPSIPTLTNQISDSSIDSNDYTVGVSVGALKTYLSSEYKKTSTISGADDTALTTVLSVKDFVSTAIGNITGLSSEIVDTLPETGNASTMYLVLKSVSESGNIYDEYFYINESWELVGTTAMDLSEYIKKEDLVALTNEQIEEIYTLAKGGSDE